MGLVLAALAVGMSNFGASIALGAAGVDRRTKAWILGSFFVFETGMPLVGVAVGEMVAGTLGGAGQWVAGALLLTVGVVSLVQVRRGDDRPFLEELTPRRIVAGSLLLSLDNLAVGFALGAFGVPLLAAALVFGIVSVSLALLGFELGRRTARFVSDAESFAGVLLIVVGLGVLTHLL